MNFGLQKVKYHENFYCFINQSFTKFFNHLLALQREAKNVLKGQIDIFSIGNRMARGTVYVQEREGKTTGCFKGGVGGESVEAAEEEEEVVVKLRRGTS
jgi:hypothetical protein